MANQFSVMLSSSICCTFFVFLVCVFKWKLVTAWCWLFEMHVLSSKYLKSSYLLYSSILKNIQISFIILADEFWFMIKTTGFYISWWWSQTICLCFIPRKTWRNRVRDFCRALILTFLTLVLNPYCSFAAGAWVSW